MADPSAGGWELPVDVLYSIGTHYLNNDAVNNPPSPEEFAENRIALRNLSLASSSIWRCLEPLRFRTLDVHDCGDVVVNLIRLAENPTARRHVVHIYCSLDIMTSWKGQAAWQRAFGDTRSMHQLLKEAGFDINSKLIEEFVGMGLHAPPEDDPIGDWDRFGRANSPYGFMLGCILMMVPDLESLTFLEIRKLDPAVNSLASEARSKGYPFLPKLDAVNYGFTEFYRGIRVGSTGLMLEPSLWHNVKRVVLCDIDFDTHFATMTKTGFIAPELDLRELVIRLTGPWKPRERDPDIGMYDVIIRGLGDGHRFDALKNLRSLEIDYPFPLDFHLGKIGCSPMLTAISNSVGLPETLRLNGHPIPHILKGTKVHERLKFLHVKRWDYTPRVTQIDRHGVRMLHKGEESLVDFSDCPALEVVELDSVQYHIKGPQTLLTSVDIKQDPQAAKRANLVPAQNSRRNWRLDVPMRIDDARIRTHKVRPTLAHK